MFLSITPALPSQFFKDARISGHLLFYWSYGSNLEIFSVGTQGWAVGSSSLGHMMHFCILAASEGKTHRFYFLISAETSWYPLSPPGKEHLHLLPERERQSKAGVPFPGPFPLPFLPSQRQGPTETCISFSPSSVQISTIHASTQFLWPSRRSQGTLSSFYKFISRGQRDLQPKHWHKHSLKPPSSFGFSLKELSHLSSPLSNFVSMVYDSPSSVATSCFVLFHVVWAELKEATMDIVFGTFTVKF